jgi:predicted transposase YdaD
MLLTDWDWNIALQVRFEEGFEEGWDNGINTVRERVARVMKEKGTDVNLIAQVTELPLDTVLQM